MAAPALDVCIQQGGRSASSCGGVDAQTNSLSTFMEHAEALGHYIGSERQDMLGDLSGEEGQGSAAALAELESVLRSLGDTAAADQIAEHTRDIHERARAHAVKMRRHVETVAEVLWSLPDVLEDAAEARAALQQIGEVAHGAFTSTEHYTQAFTNFTDELWHIGQGSANTQREADEEGQNVKLYGTSAALETVIGSVSGAASAGGAGIGWLASVKGASWARSIPLAGEMLTTMTTTCAAGGVRGALGLVTAELVFCPVGVMAGLGFSAVCGLLTVSQVLQVASDVRRRNLAREKKDRAIKRMGQSEDALRMLEEAGRLMNQKIACAELHASLWWGIRASAQDAVHSLPTSGGFQRFALNKRMKLFAKQMPNVVNDTALGA